MAHYVSSTCSTMVNVTRDGEEDTHVWREVIPDEALHHTFLMEGILALSALHYADKNASLRWRYTEIAIHYQNSALRRYHQALDSINSANDGALFAYSIIVSILALAFPNVCQEPTASSHIDSVTTLIGLLQGIGLIVQATDLPIQNGKYAAIFGPYPPTHPPPTPSEDIFDALSRLRDRVDSIEDSDDPNRHQAYISGIEALETSFAHVQQHSDHLGHAIAWLSMVGVDLQRLFRQGDAMAQLIFVHYGVLLLYTRDRWWGRNTGYGVIKSLASAVCEKEPSWVSWTAWARNRAEQAVKEDSGP
jgi:hypothetical protein